MPNSKAVRKGFRLATILNTIGRALSRVGHLLVAILGPGVYFLGMFNTIASIGFEAQDKPLPQKIAYGLLSAGLLAAAVAIFVVAAPIWGPIFTLFSMAVNTALAFKNMFKAIFHRLSLPAEATILEKRLANTAIIQQAINAITNLVSAVAVGLMVFFPPAAIAAGIVLAVFSAIAIVNHISLLFSAKEKQELKELVATPEPSRSESHSESEVEDAHYHLLHNSFEEIDSELPHQHPVIREKRAEEVKNTENLAASDTDSPSVTSSEHESEDDREPTPLPTIPRMKP